MYDCLVRLNVRSFYPSTISIETHPYLQSDDNIILTRGPLAGVQGLFIRSAERRRLIRSRSLLQRPIAIAMPSDWVAAAPIGLKC